MLVFYFELAFFRFRGLVLVYILGGRGSRGMGGEEVDDE